MNSKNHKRGLVIGKFYPLHRGHELLIETAISECEELTVIICETGRYEIPVSIRKSWIETLFPSVKIIVFEHGARLDSTSLDISQEWSVVVKKLLGYSPDVVFSSEDYGSVFSRYLGSEHVLVDRSRTTIPVSGTKIRESIFDNWSYISDVAKDYYPRRVVVLGAESTGTTTLSVNLAKHFSTAWVPEYGRTYYEGQMFSNKSEKWNSSEFVHIMNQQKRMEDALVKKASKVLVCDTDSFATKVWHLRYVGKNSDVVNSNVRLLKDSLYLLTAPDIPFVQDGTRDGEKIRCWMHEKFIEELNAEKLNYVVIDGVTEEKRLEKSVFEIENLYNIAS